MLHYRNGIQTPAAYTQMTGLYVNVCTREVYTKMTGLHVNVCTCEVYTQMTGLYVNVCTCEALLELYRAKKPDWVTDIFYISPSAVIT